MEENARPPPLSPVEAILAENSILQHDDHDQLITLLSTLSEALLQALHDQNTLLRNILETLQNTPPITPIITLSEQPNNPPPAQDAPPPAPTIIQLDGARLIDAAVIWLTENDPEKRLSLREAAAQSGMSRMTISRARETLKRSK